MWRKLWIHERQVVYSLADGFTFARKALNLWAKKKGSGLSNIKKDFWAEHKVIDPEHTFLVPRVNIC